MKRKIPAENKYMGEVGKVHEEIIKYNICSQKNTTVNDAWSFFNGVCLSGERHSHRFWNGIGNRLKLREKRATRESNSGTAI